MLTDAVLGRPEAIRSQGHRPSGARPRPEAVAADGEIVFRFEMIGEL